jgi:hypothetical protein
VSSNFLNLLERLVNTEIDFVIIGGFAGVVHGCTYVTQDIDICCDFKPSILLAIQKAISDLHPIHRMTPGRKKLELTEQTCSQFKNLYLDTDIGQLDCLGFVDGLGEYDAVRRESEFIEVEKMKLLVLGLDALIKTKKVMNRPRDKEAVLQLEVIKKMKEAEG